MVRLNDMLGTRTSITEGCSMTGKELLKHGEEMAVNSLQLIAIRYLFKQIHHPSINAGKARVNHSQIDVDDRDRPNKASELKPGSHSCIPAS
ncbi:MAG: hypothetical protein JKY52_18870 [Flavobacteriales bacterium]|nr:hypothetical protein [Flavobacteriales bacterium]